MKKFKYLLPLLAIPMLLVACDKDEDTKEKVIKDPPTEIVEKDNNGEKNNENDSTGNETLDFMNENASDYDELLEEAINSNKFSAELIDKKSKETVEFIEKLYGKDKSLSSKEAIAKYLKDNTLLSDSQIDSDYSVYFASMNVPGETSEFKYTIDKALQSSVDTIEMQFKADVTFYKEGTKEKIDSITRYHTVIIAQNKEDKDKFRIIKLVMNE